MENEIKKRNRGLVILVVILIIAVLGLGGYIVYDIFLSNNKTSDNNKNNVKEKVLSTQEALSLGDSLYSLAETTFWGDNAVISDVDSKIKDVNGKDMEVNEITNYAELSSHYTESYLTNNSNSIVCGAAYQNGKLYMVGGGRGSDVSYISTKLSSTNIDTDKITYNAVSTYCDDIDYSIGDDSCNKKSTRTENFAIVKVNGTWLIDSFKNPN